MIFGQAFTYVVSSFTDILGTIFDFLASPISSVLPDLNDIIIFINMFWTYFFGYFNWIRDALMIDSLSISLVVDILTIKFVVKPVIQYGKIFINWIKELI